MSTTVGDYIERMRAFAEKGWDVHPFSYQLRDESSDKVQWKARFQVWDNRKLSHSVVHDYTDTSRTYDSEDLANAAGLALAVHWLEEHA
jgi:hypothetical protein